MYQVRREDLPIYFMVSWSVYSAIRLEKINMHFILCHLDNVFNFPYDRVTLKLSNTTTLLTYSHCVFKNTHGSIYRRIYDTVVSSLG